MPIRKIPKNYRNVTGVAASRKAIGSAEFESTLERDFIALLEFSPEVERFEVQPLKIVWREELGNLRSYTPDVLVEFKPDIGRSPWLCEVKYRADLKKDWDEMKPKLRQGVHHARLRNWRFRLVTEVEIRTTYLKNVRFLRPFKYRRIPDSSTERLLAQLRSVQCTTPTGLIHAITADARGQAEWLPALWHLMACHRVGVNLESALTMDTPIWSVS